MAEEYLVYSEDKSSSGILYKIVEEDLSSNVWPIFVNSSSISRLFYNEICLHNTVVLPYSHPLYKHIICIVTYLKFLIGKNDKKKLSL